MARKVHISIALDRSSSMEICRSEAVKSVNSYLTELKGERALDARISLMLFSSNGIDAIRDRVPAKSCPALALHEFSPRGETPLLDAVGYAAGLLDCLSDKDERRILAILTDGLENASHEFTRARLKALLDTKERQEGWLVLYLAATPRNWSDAGKLMSRRAQPFALRKSGMAGRGGPIPHPVVEDETTRGRAAASVR